MGKAPFKLCLITDRKAVNGNLSDVLENAVEGGVDAVQIREKDLSAKEIYETIIAVRKKIGNKAKIIVNDRIDSAIAAGADGIHIGWKSIPVDKAVAIAQRHSMFTGVSCHSVEDALRCAEEKVDYISFGPVFETPSKKGIIPARGIEGIREVKELVSVPLTAIGGINENNCADVIGAGADAVSVIRAVLSSDNPRKSAENLKGIIDNV